MPRKPGKPRRKAIPGYSSWEEWINTIRASKIIGDELSLMLSVYPNKVEALRVFLQSLKGFRVIISGTIRETREWIRLYQRHHKLDIRRALKATDSDTDD